MFYWPSYLTCLSLVVTRCFWLTEVDASELRNIIIVQFLIEDPVWPLIRHLITENLVQYTKTYSF